jgi:ABC-2 type transport system ATP-binding protein
MAVVTVDRLSKRYGPRLAVDRISFEVGEREVMGLLGPNGSGKTTILRILTGYLRPSGGTASIEGIDIVEDGLEARARVGYVPEDAPLYPHMRVDELLDFMGRLRGLEGDRLRRGIDLAVERLSLGAVRTTIIGRLSRGYRQRVSLAQAVLHEPKLLVLDEPTNGLDPRQIIELRGLVRGLAEHCAVLVTSHVLGEIERVADRAAILLDGRLLAIHAIERGAVVRVRARAGDADRVDRTLAAVPGVASFDEEHRGKELVIWAVRLDRPAVAEQLGQALRDAGLGVVEIAEQTSRLESVFLELTAAKALQ